MAKICFVFNMAPKYVAASYVLFDRELDIKWCFGSNNSDIKEMDHSLLKDVKVYPTKVLKKGYILSGINEVARENDIKNYVLIGDPTCWSMWVLPRLIRIYNPKASIYFWTHGWYGKESKLKVLIKKYFFNQADGVLLYGNYAKKLMIQNGFSADMLFTIHNSLDHDRQVNLRNTINKSEIYTQHFNNNLPVLIFIGRLTSVKKLNQVIEALGILKTKGEHYNLIFIGEGSEKNNLQQLVNNLNLNDSVWFYGACYDEHLNAELIYNADLCVAPGNVGLTAMHTMVYGTPVLTHNDFKWQMPEFEAIIEGKTGCFFERDNVSSLAESISSWFLTNNDRREQVRSACYREIDENWTPEFELSVLKQVLK